MSENVRKHIFCFYVLYNKIHVYHNKSCTTQGILCCLPESYPKETEIHGYFLPGVHISWSMSSLYFQRVLHPDAVDPPFPFLPGAKGICEFSLPIVQCCSTVGPLLMN